MSNLGMPLGAVTLTTSLLTDSRIALGFPSLLSLPFLFFFPIFLSGVGVRFSGFRVVAWRVRGECDRAVGSDPGLGNNKPLFTSYVSKVFGGV